MAATGMGRGTPRMEKRRSGGETSSMGYMKDTIEMRLLRMIGSSVRRDDCRVLNEEDLSWEGNSGWIACVPFLGDALFHTHLFCHVLFMQSSRLLE